MRRRAVGPTWPFSAPTTWLRLEPDDLPAVGDPVVDWFNRSTNGNPIPASAGATGANPTVVSVSGFKAARLGNAAGSATLGPWIDLNRNYASPWVVMIVANRDVAEYSQAYLGHDSLYQWHGGHTTTGDGDKVINQSLAAAQLKDGTAYVNGIATNPKSVLKSTSLKVLDFQTTGALTTFGNIGNDRDGAWALIDVVALYAFAVFPSATIRSALYLYLNQKFGFTLPALVGPLLPAADSDTHTADNSTIKADRS